MAGNGLSEVREEDVGISRIAGAPLGRPDTETRRGTVNREHHEGAHGNGGFCHSVASITDFDASRSGQSKRMALCRPVPARMNGPDRGVTRLLPAKRRRQDSSRPGPEVPLPDPGSARCRT